MLTKPLMTMYIKVNFIPIPIFLCAKSKKIKGKFLSNILFKVFITSRQIDEEVETVTNFIFLGSKIIVDGAATL